MSSSSVRGAVVVGGYITGLSTVRALSGLGIPIAVVVTTPADIAQHSRWTSECHELLQFSSRPESLIDLLEQQSKRWNGWVVLSNYDDAVAVMCQNRERLERWYRFVTPPWEITRRLLHKNSLYETANSLGIDIPNIYGDAASETIVKTDKFPVLVKPVESRPFFTRFGVKLFVAHDQSELTGYVNELQVLGFKAQIMDFIPGPDSLFYNYTVYIDKSGNPAAELAMKKLRKSPPFFGVVRVGEVIGEVIKADKLREPTLELLRRVGWRGIASAEYKLDPRDGRYRLMDVNCRPFLMQGLALRAGVNYPLLAWQEAASGEKVRASYNGWNGVWINFLDDVYYGAFFRKSEGLSLQEYLAPYRRPKTYAVWSADDPKPFLMLCYKSLKKSAEVVFDHRNRVARRSRVQGVTMNQDKQV